MDHPFAVGEHGSLDYSCVNTSQKTAAFVPKSNAFHGMNAESVARYVVLFFKKNIIQSLSSNLISYIHILSKLYCSFIHIKYLYINTFFR